MEAKELQKRINAANDKMISEDSPMGPQEGQQAPSGLESANTPVDYYQSRSEAIRKANSRKFLNGSTQKVAVDVAAVADRLAPLYNKAKDDSERLARIGDKERSRICKEQYMRDIFLPAVESLVLSNSPEEVLGAIKSLDKLDKFALIEGGKANGYTAAFISRLHSEDLGTVVPTSDTNVTEGVRRISRLINSDQIRLATGTAKRLKERIDNGEITASDDDYDLIQRVVLRGA